MTVAFYTGWRVPSELLTRQKHHLIDGTLVLEADEAKNEQPRRFPLDDIPELRETIERQLEETRKLEIEAGRVVPLLWGRPIVDTVVRGCGLVPPPAFPAAFHTTSDVPPPKPDQRQHRSAHHHATSRLGGYLHAQGLQHHRPGHAPPWRRQTERLSRPAKEEALKAGGDPRLTDWTRKVGAKSHAHFTTVVKNAWIYAEISGAPAGNRTRT